jgi:hypothetical protein
LGSFEFNEFHQSKMWKFIKLEVDHENHKVKHLNKEATTKVNTMNTNHTLTNNSNPQTTYVKPRSVRKSASWFCCLLLRDKVRSKWVLFIIKWWSEC